MLDRATADEEAVDLQRKEIHHKGVERRPIWGLAWERERPIVLVVEDTSRLHNPLLLSIVPLVFLFNLLLRLDKYAIKLQ